MHGQPDDSRLGIDDVFSYCGTFRLELGIANGVIMTRAYVSLRACPAPFVLIGDFRQPSANIWFMVHHFHIMAAEEA